MAPARARDHVAVLVEVNMTKVSKQESFDRVCRGLIAQGQQAVAASGHCKYRVFLMDNVVLKCAAGQLIPDERYSIGMEHSTVFEHYDPVKDRNREVSAVLYEEGHDLPLVAELQTAHDRPSDQDAKSWLQAFIADARRIGKAHGLDTSVLPQEAADVPG